MPRRNFYRNLLDLMGIYSNSWDTSNKKEIGFFFFVICFHVCFAKNSDLIDIRVSLIREVGWLG